MVIRIVYLISHYHYNTASSPFIISIRALDALVNPIQVPTGHSPLYVRLGSVTIDEQAGNGH